MGKRLSPGVIGIIGIILEPISTPVRSQELSRYGQRSPVSDGNKTIPDYLVNVLISNFSVATLLPVLFSDSTPFWLRDGFECFSPTP